MKRLARSTILFFVGLTFLVLGLGSLASAPAQEVQAAGLEQGTATVCASCHKDIVARWQSSKHGGNDNTCFACHKLGEGEGAHPQVDYKIEPETVTCQVCHAEIANEWRSSKHGEINLPCASCHDPHSQQQKLTGELKTTCENCHRKQLEASHDSTHAAANVTCSECHLGPQIGHTFISEISTCESCHANIHEANSIVAGGLQVKLPQNGDAVGEPEVRPITEPEPVVIERETGRGGIYLPTWLFFVVGILVGGGGVWVLIERELDTPLAEKEDEEEEA
jgi:hypothetical protein